MAATTVNDLITDIRYDLRDFGKKKYDDGYLVRMLNRGMRILERELISFKSTLTVHRSSTTLSTAANTMALDKTVDSIRRVYIGQTELYKISMEQMYRRQIDIIGSTTGQPYYYSLWGKPTGSGGRNVVFDYTANIDYTVDYIYDKLTGDLVVSDYMPYDDMFNDYLREGIVVLCQKAKDDKIVSVDMFWREIFRKHIFELELAASRKPRYYPIDF